MQIPQTAPKSPNHSFRLAHMAIVTCALSLAACSFNASASTSSGSTHEPRADGASKKGKSAPRSDAVSSSGKPVGADDTSSEDTERAAVGSSGSRASGEPDGGGVDGPSDITAPDSGDAQEAKAGKGQKDARCENPGKKKGQDKDKAKGEAKGHDMCDDE